MVEIMFCIFIGCIAFLAFVIAIDIILFWF